MTTTIPTSTTPEPGPNDVTESRAQMLANHCIYVQGGYSDPATERKRAEAQLAASPGSIDWAKMQTEIDEAIRARLSPPPAPAAEPEPTAIRVVEPEPAAPAATSTRRDVTAVLASIDQGEALRDRIKALTAELKIHEDNIRDALGSATVGVDAAGKVIVRYPHRNRSGLSKEKVKDLLSPEDYARCEKVTEYRTLLYGEG